MNDNVKDFLERMDPGLFDLQEMEAFDEVAQHIYDESQEEAKNLDLGRGKPDLERIAFVLTMQSEAINKLVDEIEALRPSIRFITSVLLGNTEVDDD